MRNLRIAAITLFILCSALSANAQGRLMAGTGKSDITPPVGTPLAGCGARLGRPSTGVHDPTAARALIIDNGAEKIAFLSLTVLMNFAAHPTVVGDKNFEFSADYVYYARRALEQMIGGDVMALFANGAQGTVAPRAFQGKDEFQRAENLGTILAAEVYKVTLMVTPQDTVDIRLVRHPFQALTVSPPRAPVKITLPPAYATEVCGISFDNRIAFVTIPGELSSIRNLQVKERGHLLGFEKTFILGLTNDALGYILTEDEYRHGTYESSISLFGAGWGSFITNEAFQALEKLRPLAGKQ